VLCLALYGETFLPFGEGGGELVAHEGGGVRTLLYAVIAYDVGMDQITVRKINPRCVDEAKRLAKSRGVAMNTIFREVLEKGLGIASAERTNGLERFAGDSDFGNGWESHLEELKQVNPADWE